MYLNLYIYIHLYTYKYIKGVLKYSFCEIILFLKLKLETHINSNSLSKVIELYKFVVQTADLLVSLL